MTQQPPPGNQPPQRGGQAWTNQPPSGNQPPPGNRPPQGGGPAWLNQPPPKQKNWFVRHKLLTVLFAVLLLGGIGSAVASGGKSATDNASTSTSESTGSAPTGERSSDASSSAASQSKTTSAPTSAAPGIGTPVRDGKFEFTITKVTTGNARVGSADFGQQAQGQYVFVYVTVKNIGTQPQTMFDSNQKITDGQGRQFDPDTAAAIYLPDNDVWMKDVNPGNSLSGILVYDMPRGAVPVSIELHDSMFSGGVKVSLK